MGTRTLIEKNIIDFATALNTTKDGNVVRFVVTQRTTCDGNEKADKTEIKYEVQCKEELHGKQVLVVLLPYITIIAISVLLIISLFWVEPKRKYSCNVSTIIKTELTEN